MDSFYEDIEGGEGEEYLLESQFAQFNYCKSACDIDERVLATLPVTLTSSCLSVIGSILIIIPFLKWSDIRKSNIRRLLFLLAIADLLTATGFIAAVTRHYIFYAKYSSSIHNNNNREGCLLTSAVIRDNENYLKFCKGQAFVTVYFQCVSFFLTAFIAVYFFIILVFHKPKIARKLMVPFCITAWGLPLVICGYVLAKRKFGIGDSRSSVAWCFIDNHFSSANLTQSQQSDKLIIYFMFEGLAEKFWELLTFFVIIVCYLSIFVLNRCKYKKKYTPKVRQKDKEATTSLIIPEDDPGQWNTAHAINSTPQPNITRPVKGRRDVVLALSKADMRLALVPLVFLLLRVWGMIRYFVSMIPGCHQYVPHYDGIAFFCIDEKCFTILYNHVLLYLHAFGEPAQGFGNCILFVFFSKPIVTRLFGPIIKCCNCRRKNKNNSSKKDSSSPSKKGSSSPSPPPQDSEGERVVSRVIVTYKSKSTNDQSVQLNV